MKKIDKLIITSFIGPSILSYFVATFVLVMQFLWKYIDEILGKGFTIFDILELIFYYSVTLIPLAVPITILISSVMVFGDMAEKYELSSMKSAGISLLRIMLPSIAVAVFIGAFSIFASNFLKPAANLQFQKRFLALRKQKSALAIEEGIFNDAFGETIIRVNKIDKNGRDIHDVLIYDHTQNDKSLIGITSAKGGQMFTVDEGRYFVMKLDTGIQYREMEKKSKLGSNKSEMPFMRTYYDEWTKTFDMSQFDAEEGILNFNRNREDMMNTVQLLKAVDTFQNHINKNKNTLNSRVSNIFSGIYADSIQLSKTNKNTTVADSISGKKGSGNPTNFVIHESVKLNSDSSDNKKISGNNISAIIKSKNQVKVINRNIIAGINQAVIPKKLITQNSVKQISAVKYFAETIDSLYFNEVVIRAQTNLSRDRDELLTLKNINYDYTKSRHKYLLRLFQQYSWGVICVIFLFIGAPLGSIIRKGGYGYPLLVAILFYMIFIITTILGEKLVRNELMGGIQAAWLPCLILSPFALFLTIMALRDIKLNPLAMFDFIIKLRKKIPADSIKKQS